VDLVIAEGVSLQEAVAEAREKARQVKEEGVDQAALDAAAAKGFGNALFEYDEDEMTQVVEEFYPATKEKPSLNNSSVVSKLREDLSSTRSAASG
jgi:TRAP-type C4-dicarboxylate transport system substrate-binding protein